MRAMREQVLSRRVKNFRFELLKMLRSPVRKPVTSCRFGMVVAPSTKVVAVEMERSGLGHEKWRGGIDRKSVIFSPSHLICGIDITD